MRYILAVLFTLTFLCSDAQIGGTYAFEWLQSPLNARLTALGGSQITVKDNDLALAAANPSLLNANTHRQISVNHSFTFADIGTGFLGYGHSIDSITYAYIGIGYATYGDFIGADAIGNETAIFSGSEVALQVGVGRQMNERISLGVSFKPVYGTLESYNSFGLAADVGLTYQKPNAPWSASFLVKNIGTQFSAYGNETSSMPLDVQIGYSRKLKYLPFRFSILLHNLHRWDVRYDDPNAPEETDILGNPINTSSDFSKRLDNLFRHVALGGEFLLGKNQNFRVRFGYNHLRRKELTVSSFRSLAGFSGGIGFKIKGFRIDYGIGYYHLAGGTNHLSISTDLGRFF